MQKDWVVWSTKVQEKVDLGLGGPEFQRFAVEKVSGSILSWLDFTLNSFSSWRWQNGGTSPSTGWPPLPSFSWFTTNISSKIQRSSFVELSPSWDLRRTRSAFLAWRGAGLGDFLFFCLFVFFCQVWEVPAQKHSFEESCLLGEHSCKGDAHLYMFSNSLQPIH